MFGELFPVVRALDSVPHFVTAVGAVKQVAVTVEVQTKTVSAAFAEKFEIFGDWMITPDTLLELDPADVAGRRPW